MITGPLFKWFGSKWTAAKHYPAPIHDTIVEPFAGSAGYSLRHHHKNVVLAESDAHLYTLWKWLVEEATETAIREMPINVPEGTDIRELGMSHGQTLLMKTWQRTNNVGTCFTVSSWGNKSGQWTENTRSRVASEFHHVKHWKIQPRAMVTMLELTDPCTWFVDPPYKFNYQYRSSPIDYATLATQVEGLSGQVIVCEAVCSKTGKVPDWLPFTSFRDTVTSRRGSNNHHHSKELIYMRSK